MTIFIIPVATIIVFVVFFFVGMMLWIRQRRRDSNRTVFIPPRNFVMPMQPTNPNYRSPMQPTQPIPYHSPYVVNPPMPVPQPFYPTPVIPNPPLPPQPTESDLMERMRQVQLLMVEIHRLESESGERNEQRVQELKQRVIELSNPDRHGMPSDPVQPPPAYPAHENDNKGRPEYADGRG
ncbi:hypothetical protein BYT27DRAFT_7189005 [Phlegmacium glaucopus]|nr:hypothetical protein BYT27DRAFT_7189005 [Phlegmacium glaucopus]